MSIQHLDARSASVILSDRLQCEVPFNLADNRLTAYVCAVFETGTTPSLTTPSGWTQISGGPSINGSTVFLTIFTRAGGAVDPVDLLFNRTFRIAIVYISTDDAVDSTPIDANNKAAGSSTITHQAPSVTTTVSNGLVQAVYAVNQVISLWPPSLSTPVGMQALTHLYDGASTFGDNIQTLTLLIGEVFQGAAGSSGTRTAQSGVAGNGAYYMLALKPSQAPTRPGFITPLQQGNPGPVRITQGVTYAIALSPSTSPLIAQSSIRYVIDYSSTGQNGSFTNITTTAAGVLTANWNTTGLAPGNAYILRARAWDETNSKFSPYNYTVPITIAADVAPGAPLDLHAEQPEGMRITPGNWLLNPAINIANECWIKGMFNDPGDAMSGFDVDHGTDNASFPNTSTTNSSVYSKNYAGSTFAAGTRYFRSRTKDNAATYGPYAFLAIPMGSLPATPNITSPTTTITTARPTFTFTSGGHAGFRFRVVIGGLEVHDSGIILSSGSSYTLSFNFSNSTSPTVFLSVYSSIGLRSAEDSEAYTVTYTPPATPTIQATAFSERGYNLIEVSNSDTPDEVRLYRFLSGFEAITTIEIARGLGPDAVFLDYQAPDIDTHRYKAMALDSNGLEATSAQSSAITLALMHLWIHLADRGGINSNARGLAVGLLAAGPFRVDIAPTSRSFNVAGRGVVTSFGQTVIKRIAADCIIEISESEKLARLYEIFDDGGIVCLRGAGERQVFGFLEDTRKDIAAHQRYWRVPIRAIETNYPEDLRQDFIP